MTITTGKTTETIAGSETAAKLAKMNTETGKKPTTKARGAGPFQGFVSFGGPDLVTKGKRNGEDSYALKRSKWEAIEGQKTASGDPAFRLVRAASRFIVTDFDLDIRDGEVIGELLPGTRVEIPRRSGNGNDHGTYHGERVIDGLTYPAAVWQDGTEMLFREYRESLANPKMRKLSGMEKSLPDAAQTVSDKGRLVKLAQMELVEAEQMRKDGKCSGEVVGKYREALATAEKIRDAAQKVLADREEAIAKLQAEVTAEAMVEGDTEQDDPQVDAG